MARAVRNGPSGRKVEVETPIPTAPSVGQAPVWDGNAYVPGIPIGIPQSAIGINWSAPIVLTLVPANHPAGVYAVKLDIINRVAPTTGTFTRTISYSAPIFGATSDVRSGITTGSTGHLNANALAVISVSSDGVNPIVLTLTPAGITGAPVVDIYAATF